MVKAGFRKPSLTKSISARTRGRATRAIKKAIIPGYGQRGAGWLHPRRKLYNTIYSKITVDTRKIFSGNMFNNVDSNQKVEVTGKFTYVLTLIQFFLNRLLYYGQYIRTISGWGVIIFAFILPRLAAYLLALWIFLWFATMLRLIKKMQ